MGSGVCMHAFEFLNMHCWSVIQTFSFFNLCILLKSCLKVKVLRVGVTTLAYFKHGALFKGAYLNKHGLYCGC